MILFASEKYLWLLLLVPLFPILYAVMAALRRKRVRRLASKQMAEVLMPHYSAGKGWARVILFSLGFFFFVIGLARPQIGAKLSEHRTRGAEIMICLDVSNSMLAQDYSPSRLERAKMSISSMVDKLRDDRIGLIIFAGTSFVQLPVTSDFVSAKVFLSSIDTGSIPVQGTAIGDAIMTAAKSFSAQSEKSRVIVLITDGENHEDDAVAAAREVAKQGIRIYTIGVGSAQGQPVPVNGSLLEDKDGNIVVSKLDEGILKQIAQAGGGAYVHAGNQEFGLNPIIDEIRAMESEEFSSVVFEEYDEQYMYFFALALLLFAIEALIGERRSKRSLFK